MSSTEEKLSCTEDQANAVLDELERAGLIKFTRQHVSYEQARISAELRAVGFDFSQYASVKKTSG